MELKMNEKQAGHLDLILKTLLDPKTDALSVKLVNKELLPNESYEYCLELYYLLKAYPQDLLYPEVDPEPDNFWATDYVTAFIHSGGFTKIYNDEYDRQLHELEKEQLEREKLKYDLKNAKRIYKSYWFTFSFAVIALVLSILNFFKGCSPN